MNTDIRTEYHGETIHYLEKEEQWEWRVIGGENIKSKSLKTIKGKINEAQKEVFVGCTAYLTNYGDFPSIVEVLSRVEDNGGHDKFWVREKKPGSRRTQERIENLRAFSAANRAIVAKWIEAKEVFEAEQKDYNKYIKEGYDQLAFFVEPEVKNGGGGDDQ